MASEKKITKPVPKPTIHNHYGVDKHLLNVLLGALIVVVLYFAFTAFLYAPPQTEQTHRVRILSSGVEKDIVLPRESLLREAPPPRIQ